VVTAGIGTVVGGVLNATIAAATTASMGIAYSLGFKALRDKFHLQSFD
jgi:hypothetical protein